MPADAEIFDVEVARDFDAPADRLWSAWSTAEGIRAWWGPGPFTCPFAEVDMRPGGKALVAMRAPEEFGGGDQWSTWNYTVVEPLARLEYVFRFTDETGTPTDPPFEGVPAAGTHEVEFHDIGGGRSQLRMIERGYSSRAARDMSQQGLEACLDKMSVYVTAR